MNFERIFMLGEKQLNLRKKKNGNLRVHPQTCTRISCRQALLHNDSLKVLCNWVQITVVLFSLCFGVPLTRYPFIQELERRRS
jgi:hypothetical protein